MIRAARITVGVDELRSGWVEHARNRPELVEIPPTPGFSVVVVEVLLLAPDVGPVLDASFTVGRIARSGDVGAVLIVAHSTNLTDPIRGTLTSQIDIALAGMRASGWDGSATRFVIFGVDPIEGCLDQFEFAAEPWDALN
jgi:hypothetical protein